MIAKHDKQSVSIDPAEDPSVQMVGDTLYPDGVDSARDTDSGAYY